MKNNDLVMSLFETTQLLQKEIQNRLSTLNLRDEITGQRLRVLWEISRAGNLRMSELAGRMGIQPRTVTQFIDALEVLGLVTRTPDPKDRRATRLRLTDAAQSVVLTFRDVVSAVNDRISAVVSPEDQDALEATLLQIHAALQDNAAS